MSATIQSSRVESVVQRGWRRRLLVLAVEQSSVALAVMFGGLALLIILGTQILEWPWMLGICAAGFGLSAWGVRRRLRNAYTVAQMMDQHLSLHDSLSTAWFLRVIIPLPRIKRPRAFSWSRRKNWLGPPTWRPPFRLNDSDRGWSPRRSVCWRPDCFQRVTWSLTN